LSKFHNQNTADPEKIHAIVTPYRLNTVMLF
jgi:hypothetical protein